MATRSVLAAVSLIVTAATAACAPSSSPASGSQGAALPSPVIDDASSFKLDALVAAAKKEGSVTVYDSTGDITAVAQKFSAKYGIKATGVKSKVGDTLEKMTREAQANNVTIDMTLYEDGPSLVGQLLPQKVVYTWIPADLAGQIPAANQNPLMVLSKANVWVYNPKLFPDGCPVKNIWDLTDPKWKGKVAMQDPLGKPNLIEWFTQMAARGDGDLRAAYQAKNGKDLKTSEKSVAEEWVKQLAGNAPILTASDDDAAAAVASPNQTQPRLGLVSNAKFRDVADKGYQMRVCDTLKPWAGFQYPKYAAIATKTTHPNAAKLFMHFVFTQEGIAGELQNGGIPGNTRIPMGDFTPPGLTDWNKQLFVFDAKNLPADYRDAQSMQDLWRLNHR